MSLEYNLPNDNERYEAPFSEIYILEEKDVPNEIKDTFIQSEDEESESGVYSFLEMS